MPQPEYDHMLDSVTRGAFAYFVPSATWSPVSRLNLTRAIVEEGTLSVDAFVESTGDRALRNGHWYCDKAPLPSLIAVPAYAAFHAYNRLRGVKPEFVAYSTPDTPAQPWPDRGPLRRRLARNRR